MTAVRTSGKSLYTLFADGLRDVWSAELTIAFLCAASLAQSAVLPDGPGKAETVKLCGRCHSLDQAVSLRQEQAGWAETISKMVNLGAQGSEDDLNTVLNYLVKFYGPATWRRSLGVRRVRQRHALGEWLFVNCGQRFAAREGC